MEYLDSLWINEIYRPHSKNLLKVVKDVIREVHTLDRYEELAGKKNVIRKIVNVINQTEFNVSSNSNFLSISYGLDSKG